MTTRLEERVAAGLTRAVETPVRAFAEHLAETTKPAAILFYGSNLRTGSLEGVLDYYVLMPGEPERGLWPRVSYHELTLQGTRLRAKVATMTLARFRKATAGDLLDTTVWARFVQPSALVWQRDAEAERDVVEAIAAASMTAARLAVALGPGRGTADAFWTALFQATYRAEFRVETPGRAQSILDLNRDHFEGLLPVALEAAGIACDRDGSTLAPRMTAGERRRVRRWWRKRRIAGKPLNVLRLVRATSTFDGAARYAAWKVERHTGVAVEVTPWRERHPVLAAPGVLWSVWRARRKAG